MGRIGRGALWALFPPAGFIASRRAARRDDVARQERGLELLEQAAAAAAPAHVDGRRELVEQLTATANDPNASKAARRLAEKKLHELGQ